MGRNLLYEYKRLLKNISVRKVVDNFKRSKTTMIHHIVMWKLKRFCRRQSISENAIIF
jgi:hypothetical protein